MRFQIKPFRVLKTFFSLLLCSVCVFAQAGETYDLSHNVVAGGGEKSTSALYKVEGTIGQSAAGTVSNGTNAATNTQHSLRGGFWAFESIAPTVAAVSIGGRVLNFSGGTVSNVRISLFDASSGTERTALTNPFGHYRFEEVGVGRVYILRAESKKFTFMPEIHVLQLMDAREDLDFTAVESDGNMPVSPDYLPNKNQ